MAYISNAVKNPFPVFEQEKAPKIAFIEKLMDKANGVYSTWRFDYVVALARRDERIKRRPRPTSVRVLEAITQCALYHWDIVANKVTITAHTLAIKTGTATESAAKNVSIERARRHLHLMHRLGLIELSKTCFRKDLGCYEPLDFTFTGLFFDMLDVSQEAVKSARNGRAAWENKQRKAKNLPVLELAELAAEKVRSWLDKFAEIFRRRKAHGELRYQRRQDTARTRAEIYQIEYKAVLVRIQKGLFTAASSDEVRAEVNRRTNKRMTTRTLDTRLSTA